jgi:hypothetical protein
MGFPWAHGIPVGQWESHGPIGIPWAHRNPMGPSEPHGPMGFPWAHHPALFYNLVFENYVHGKTTQTNNVNKHNVVPNDTKAMPERLCSRS